MNKRVQAARKVSAVLFVMLGAVILGRGVADAAPLSFCLLGVLMLTLGVYRLRLMDVIATGRG